MITKNGHQKISKIITIFLLIVYSNNSRAENANFEPQINLNEILPSYDEEIYDEENNKSQEQDIIDLDSDMKLSPFARISILNKITAEVVSIDLKLKESYLHEKLRSEVWSVEYYCQWKGVFELEVDEDKFDRKKLRWENSMIFYGDIPILDETSGRRPIAEEKILYWKGEYRSF